MRVRIEGIKSTTGKAWLVRACGVDEIIEIWLPKSQCELDGENFIFVPDWLARKKSLVEVESVRAYEDVNEAEAELARDEILSGELANIYKALEQAQNLTGLSKDELLNLVKAA